MAGETLAQFCRGEIPSAVDVPTGLGKTSVMALWLVARASGARLPRRLVYVVDRRAVVDQATEVAESLRALVEGDNDLRARLALRGALPISTLRGQHLDNKRWIEDPASPAIVVGTVDMVGSRLLFGGYGVSRKMRPFHAGLLGVDTLVVLDEAHLVPPFEHLLESIGGPELAAKETVRHAVPRFRVLPLSATGRARSSDVVTLDASDAKHPIAARRLDAEKALTFEATRDGESLPEALARTALSLAQQSEVPSRCIVFCDKREDALDVEKAINLLGARERTERPPREIKTALFVGGRRARERSIAREDLDRLGFLAKSEAVPAVSAVLIATSAGEVGVDLDAHNMVCDLVAWERMVQRLGRVNRRGKHRARVIVVRAPPPKEAIAALAKPAEERNEKELRLVEHHDRSESARALFELLPRVGAAIQAGPRALSDLKSRTEHDDRVRSLLARASTPSPLRPALTRAVLESWSMTSLSEHAGRPDVQPWLRGWNEEEAETSVVFRRHLPVHLGQSSKGQALGIRDVQQFFEATAPHASEVLDTQSHRAVAWLLDRAAAFRRANPQQETNAAVAFVLNEAGDVARVIQLRELTPSREAEKKSKDRLHRQLAGRTVIVDARLGGLSQGLLDDSADDEPSTADVDPMWSADVGFRVGVIESGAPALDETQWRERLRVVVERSAQGEPRRELRVSRFDDDAATEDDRSEGTLQTLSEHQSWTEERARGLADRLQLDSTLTTVLAAAARLHDEGKRAKRWQRAFSAPLGEAYAKTPGPLRVALLDGYRHELGSLPYVERDAEVAAMPTEARDLVLHLVAAHHGFARPAIPVRACDDAPPSLLAQRARDIALRFTRLEKAWGPWGLAWLEALLRAADQQASRANDDRGAR